MYPIIEVKVENTNFLLCTGFVNLQNILINWYVFINKILCCLCMQKWMLCAGIIGNSPVGLSFFPENVIIQKNSA